MTIRTILPPRGRDYRLDLLRGFANWAIYLDHIPNNAVNWLTQRNYGFSDAADLFVFISGLHRLIRLCANDARAWIRDWRHTPSQSGLGRSTWHTLSCS